MIANIGSAIIFYGAYGTRTRDPNTASVVRSQQARIRAPQISALNYWLAITHSSIALLQVKTSAKLFI